MTSFGHVNQSLNCVHNTICALSCRLWAKWAMPPREFHIENAHFRKLPVNGGHIYWQFSEMLVLKVKFTRCAVYSCLKMQCGTIVAPIWQVAESGIQNLWCTIPKINKYNHCIYWEVSRYAVLNGPSNCFNPHDWGIYLCFTLYTYYLYGSNFLLQLKLS